MFLTLHLHEALSLRNEITPPTLHNEKLTQIIEFHVCAPVRVAPYAKYSL